MLTGVKWHGVILDGADLRGAAIDEDAKEQAYFASAKRAQSVDTLGCTLAQALQYHKEWSESSGSKGKRGDFSEIDLQFQDFRDKFLPAAKFNRALLTGANFTRAELAMAELSLTDCRDAMFAQADLRGAVLARGIFNGADFSGAQLEPVEIFGSTTKFWSSNLEGAKFVKACFRDTNLSGARIKGANFSGADLRGADLRNCNVKTANFKGAKIEGAKFDDAKIEGAA